MKHAMPERAAQLEVLYWAVMRRSERTGRKSFSYFATYEEALTYAEKYHSAEWHNSPGKTQLWSGPSYPLVKVVSSFPPKTIIHKLTNRSLRYPDRIRRGLSVAWQIPFSFLTEDRVIQLCKLDIFQRAVLIVNMRLQAEEEARTAAVESMTGVPSDVEVFKSFGESL